MKNKLCTWGIALMGCAPLLASAQAGKIEAPKAMPQLSYQSAFADYKPYKDVPLAAWREVNDIVAGAPGGASGHAGHGMGGMKGMPMPDTPATPASAPMQMNMKPHHDGHHKQGGKP